MKLRKIEIEIPIEEETASERKSENYSDRGREVERRERIELN